MDFNTFSRFMIELTSWARDETDPRNVGRDFLDRIFKLTDRKRTGFVNFEDCAVALGNVCKTDMLGRIEWLFTLFDGNKDGRMNNDEVIQLSECLLYLLHGEADDIVLQAMSTFVNHCFEFCETDETGKRYLVLSALRMVVLAQPVLERYVDVDMPKAFLAHLHTPSGTHEVQINQRRQIFDQLWSNARNYVSTRTKNINSTIRRRRDNAPATDDDSSDAVSPTSPDPPLPDRLNTAASVKSLDIFAEAVDVSRKSEKTNDDDVLSEVDKLLSDLEMGKATNGVDAFLDDFGAFRTICVFIE
jgi:Ca2+-binding EF-hand superfamily protein